MTMTRRHGGSVVAPALGLLLVLAVVGGVLNPGRPHAPASLGALTDTLFSRVYTVSALARGLARDPHRWIGRTVRVQGVVVADRQQRDTLDGWVLLGPPQLTEPGGQVRWPRAWGLPDPLLARLRTVPLLRRVVPPPQTVRWGRLDIYRIQLRRAPGRGGPDCYEAVLLDAAG